MSQPDSHLSTTATALDASSATAPNENASIAASATLGDTTSMCTATSQVRDDQTTDAPREAARSAALRVESSGSSATAHSDAGDDEDYGSPLTIVRHRSTVSFEDLSAYAGTPLRAPLGSSPWRATSVQGGQQLATPVRPPYGSRDDASDDDAGCIVLDVAPTNPFAPSNDDPAAPVAVRHPRQLTGKLLEEAGLTGSDFHRKCTSGATTIVTEHRDDDAVRVFDPSDVVITLGDHVFFRWFDAKHTVRRVTGPEPESREYRATEPSDGVEIRVAASGTDMLFTPADAGDYYFRCTHCDGLKCTVTAIPRQERLLRRAASIVLSIALLAAIAAGGAVGLLYYARTRSFLAPEPLPRTNTTTERDGYGGVRKLEELIREEAFPWIAAACIFGFIALIAGIVKALLPDRLRHFGRGHTEPQQRHVQFVLALLLCALVAQVVVVWYFILRSNFGFASFFRTLGASVLQVINETVALIADIRFLIKRGAPLYPAARVPSSSVELLTQVEALSNVVRVWSENGEQLVRGVFRGVAMLVFVTLQLFLYVSATGIVAVRRRRSRTMKSASVLIVWALVIAGITVGVDGLVLAIIKRTHRTAVAFQDQTLTAQQLQATTGVADDSPVLELFGACSTQGFLSVRFLDSLLDAATASFNQRAAGFGLSGNYSLAATDQPIVNVAALALHMEFVMQQLDTIARRLDDDTAVPVKMLNAFHNETVPLLQATLRVTRTMISIVDCTIFRNMLRRALPVMSGDIIEPMQSTQHQLYAILAVLAASLMATMVAAHVFARPYKFWFEPRTHRWFRFRATFLAHRRLLRMDPIVDAADAKRRRDAKWVSPPCCIKSAIVVGMYQTTLINSSVVMLQAVMLLLLHSSYEENRLGTTMQGVAWCCAVYPVFVWPSEVFDQVPIRVTHRVVAFVLALCIVAMCTFVATTSFIRSSACFSQRSDNSTNATTPLFSSRECTLDSALRDTEAGTYAVIVGIVAAVSVVTAGVMVRFAKFRASNSIGLLFAESRATATQRRCRMGYILALAVLQVLAVVAVVTVLQLGAFSRDNAVPPAAFAADNVGCNGRAEYCNRRVNELVWLTTHNSMSSTDKQFVGPNHFHGVAKQLRAGVRAFMFDVWNTSAVRDDPAMLCHTLCELGGYPFRDDLRLIADHLESHRNDVIVLLIEQYATGRQIHDALLQSRLVPQLWLAPLGSAVSNTSFRWPVLSDLVAANTRLLVFTDEDATSSRNPGGLPAGVLFAWDFLFENNFNARSVRDFSCAIDRGGEFELAVQRRKAAILNHFITAPVAAPYLALEANAPATMLAHWDTCRAAWEPVLPNFFAVDFWSLQDPLATVNHLNQQLIFGPR